MDYHESNIVHIGKGELDILRYKADEYQKIVDENWHDGASHVREWKEKSKKYDLWMDRKGVDEDYVTEMEKKAQKLDEYEVECKTHPTRIDGMDIFEWKDRAEENEDKAKKWDLINSEGKTVSLAEVKLLKIYDILNTDL